MPALKVRGVACAGALGLASLVVSAGAAVPSQADTSGPAPAVASTHRPTAKPTLKPTRKPSKSPSGSPSASPSKSSPPPEPVESCDLRERGGKKVGGEPWAQTVLNFRQAWRMSRGKGVKVAVVDSGVSGPNPQLAGQLAHPLVNLTTSTLLKDCVGHGTVIAGVIAAKAVGGNPFFGVAPDAKIIPIKVTATGENIDDRLVARGIREAVALGAKVINVSIQTPVDTPVLRSAVNQALARDVVIVAAAGNLTPKDAANPVPEYPAQYDGVISVGAVSQNGEVTQYSSPKTRVSVVAPGNLINGPWPDGGYTFDNEGTSFSAPFVAGVAALVRSYRPDLNAAEVKHRIEATADGGKGNGSGYGMVDPLQAVSAVLPEEKSPPPSPHPRQIVMTKPKHTDNTGRTIALSVAGGAAGLALLIVLAGVIIPRGNRRGWVPGRAAEPEAPKSEG